MTYHLINALKPPAVTEKRKHARSATVCVGGFLVKKNKFLLGKRSKKKDWAPGLWDIIGGHSLKDEHPMYTLQRETYEETGIHVRNAECMTIADVVQQGEQKPLFRYHIYMITHFEGKAFNKTNEHTKLQWFTRAQLDELSLALPVYLVLLDEWFAKNSCVK